MKARSAFVAAGAAMVALYFALSKGKGSGPTPPAPGKVTTEPSTFYRFTWKRAGGTMSDASMKKYLLGTMTHAFGFSQVSVGGASPNFTATGESGSQPQVFDLPLEHGPATLIEVSPIRVEP